jgi:hypothetical protein
MNPPIIEQEVYVSELSERELRALARLRRRLARLQAWPAHACVGSGSPREVRSTDLREVSVLEEDQHAFQYRMQLGPT